MARPRKRSILPTGALLGLLVGAVVVPAVLAISVGIIALILYREAFDIVLGVLVLCFAAMALTGGVVAIAFLRRSARLAEMQTDFIANVSHELRTPLAGIRLMVETLSMGRASAPGEQEKVLARTVKEVRRLEDLVTRILDWRRLESGVLELDFEEQPIHAVLGEAIDAATSDPQLCEVTVETQLPDDALQVWGDRQALVDAFRNLVHNAVKYGGEYGPVVVRAEQDDAMVRVEVRDRGPGIPTAHRRRIFDQFYRVVDHVRSKEGTGLGLAIVRRLIDAHRGTLELSSDPGAETTFIVRLPRDPRPARRHVRSG
jgi:two-component system phosphate regulon sensor histidine kinase PhoR